MKRPGKFDAAGRGKANLWPALLAIASLCSSLSTEPSLAQTWTTATNAPSASWVSLASSADGNTLAALIESGAAVYISTNAGANWTLSSPAIGVVGTGLACSADAKTLYFSGTTQI